MVYSDLQKASGKNLVSIALPAEVSAAGAVDLITKTKSIPKTAKIGILSSNVPSIDAATKTLESGFKKKWLQRSQHGPDQRTGRGFRRYSLGRAAAAAGTFQAAGVDTVFIPQSWTAVTGFLDEADKTGYKPKLFAIDGQANTCTPFAATRTNSWRLAPRASPRGTVAPSRPRTRSSPTTHSRPSAASSTKRPPARRRCPVVPAGPLTANGVTYDGDFAPPECMIANVLLPAIKKAGKDLTWNKVWNNLMATTDAPAAYLSNGKGGFGKNKPYFANPVMHFTEMAGAPPTRRRTPTGCSTAARCPHPCWVSTVVDGKEWFTVNTQAASG